MIEQCLAIRLKQAKKVTIEKQIASTVIKVIKTGK